MNKNKPMNFSLNAENAFINENHEKMQKVCL